MENKSDILLQRLDAFIRKYYTNLLLRGSLLFVSTVSAVFLFYVFTDWITSMGPMGRTLFFFAFMGFLLFTLVRWIVIPVLRLNKMGEIISYEKAARLIGRHFPDVDDKIVNTLQLRMDSMAAGSAPALVLAGIEQKTSELKPVPFLDAVNLAENRKYLRFLIPPLLMLVLLGVLAPSFLSLSTERLFNFSAEYKPVAPFRFILVNKSLDVAEQENFTVEAELKGSELPGEMYIHSGQVRYRMERKGKNRYAFVVDHVREDMSFFLEAGGFQSGNYKLHVLPRPSLADMEMSLRFPAYLHKSDQHVSKTGDLTVPEGTRVTWTVKSRNTGRMRLYMGDSAYVLKPLVTGNYTFSRVIRKNNAYALVASNNEVNIQDSLGYFLNVIPDKYPEIAVDEQVDSAAMGRRYFMGQARDDYGFSGLYFCYRHIPDSLARVTSGEYKKISVGIKSDATDARFTHYWDMAALQLGPGDRVEYYFIVYDNDGVNGAKSARTQTREFRVPTRSEIAEQSTEANKELKKDMNNALKEAEKLNKEYEKLKLSLEEKKNLNWQDKNKVENLLQKQIDLQKRMEEIRNQNELNNQRKDEFVEPDPELLEKQKMLEELMDKVIDEEMQKMIDELQKMLEKLDKNALEKQLDEMKLTNEEMKKELDRSLELFKQLEFEQKINDITEHLDELAQKQEKLAEETEKKEKSNTELSTEQQDLNREFDKVEKEMQDLRELNEELEKKHDLDQFKPEEQEISENMDKGKQDLQKSQNQKASGAQQKAAQKMKEMSQKMSSMMQTAQQQQQEENMEDLRQLLENLVTLSFDQEGLMAKLEKTSTRDPKYVKLGQEQRKLKDDAKMIEDSLFALSKRVMQLQPIINQQMGDINRNLAQALKYMEDRQAGMARSNQQFVMKSLNDLALLLDEALQQMQQQAQAQASGNGSCNKPGKGQKPGGKPGKKPGQKPGDGVQSIKSLQEQLSKQLEQLKKGLEEGGKNPGNKGKNGLMGMPGMSKELAQAAAKQAAIRQKLQELSQMMNQDGSGAGNQLRKIAEEMEKNEEDLVNKRVNIETLRRQQDILTRLLESEKAEREREWDEKRESKENKKEDFGNQKQFLEYKRRKEKEVELLKTLPPSLTPYYKKKVNEYFNTVE